MFGAGHSPTASAAANDGGVGSSDANSSVNYSATSDDQILDAGDDAGDEGDGESGTEDQGDDEVIDLNEAEESDAGEGEGHDEGEGEEEAEGEGEGEQAQDDTAPADQTQDPAQLRGIFKAHPDLRNAYYSDKAFRQHFPTVAEARQYREALPTVEDLNTAITARDTLADFDNLFYSDDPKASAEFLTRLQTDDADAFERMAAAVPQALYEANPQAYASRIAEPVIAGALGSLMQKAASMTGPQGQNLRNAIDVLSRHLFNRPYAEFSQRGSHQKSPREIELDRREARITQQETQRQSGEFQTFHNTTNEVAVNAVIGAIKTQLIGNPKAKITGLLKGTALEGNEKAINKIVGEIYTSVDATLRANKGLTTTLRNELNAARQAGYGKEAQQKIVSLILQRAKMLIPNATKTVVTEWTNDIVRGNAARVTNARRQASRADITGAGAASNTPRSSGRQRVSAGDINYGKTSDDDILSGKVTVRRQR